MKTFRLRPLVLLVLALAAPAAAQDPDVEPGAEAARRRPRPVGNPVLPGVWRLLYRGLSGREPKEELA